MRARQKNKRVVIQNSEGRTILYGGDGWGLQEMGMGGIDALDCDGVLDDEYGVQLNSVLIVRIGNLGGEAERGGPTMFVATLNTVSVRNA